jgi:hypothetical protein
MRLWKSIGLKQEQPDVPPETPILSYEAERATFEKQKKETLEWTFRRLREARLFYHERLVVLLKPVRITGFIKHVSAQKIRERGLVQFTT